MYGVEGVGGNVNLTSVFFMSRSYSNISRNILQCSDACWCNKHVINWFIRLYTHTHHAHTITYI